MSVPTVGDPVAEANGEIRLWLPADASTAATARGFVRSRWDQLDDGVLDDIELIVTELVSNAVRHGSPEVILRLRAQPMAVDVAVLDEGSRMPPTRPPSVSADSPTGRGLAIIDRLASNWGVEPFPGNAGKAVWASIAAS